MFLMKLLGDGRFHSLNEAPQDTHAQCRIADICMLDNTYKRFDRNGKSTPGNHSGKLPPQSLRHTLHSKPMRSYSSPARCKKVTDTKGSGSIGTI
jgi:hypothetical protein